MHLQILHHMYKVGNKWNKIRLVQEHKNYITTLRDRTHLSHWAQTPLELKLRDTLVGGLAHLVTFVNLPLSPSTANTHPVDHIPLLGLVAQATSFVWSGGAGGSVNSSQLSILPAAHTKEKSEEIWLLLPPELLQVLVCSHPLYCVLGPVCGNININRA